MPTPVKIENTIPVLRVSDLQASVTFYQQKLGFKHDWSGGSVGSVSRDGHPIMFSQASAPIVPGEVWIGCGDAAALHADFVAAGVRTVQPPTNQRWAVEMRVADLDGNVLWFGSDPREDLPFGKAIGQERV